MCVGVVGVQELAIITSFTGFVYGLKVRTQ
jgi:hypothetical protein